MILRDNPHVVLGVNEKPRKDIQRLKILGRQFLNEDIEV